jgi:hypothetical protein
MANDDLHKKLVAVHQELEAAENIAPDDEDLLRTILEDITSLLDRKQRTFEKDIDSLTEDLKRMTYRFEASHHDLAKSIRQVAIALGNMGI